MADNIRLSWSGLQELRTVLRQLPRTLAERAAGTVRQAGYRAAGRLAAQYPVSGRKKRTGGVRLAQGVRVLEELSTYGVMVTVRSTAKHSHLWEFGTGERRTRNRPTGRMVPANYDAPLFVPVVVEERTRMVEQIVNQLRHAGIDGLQITFDEAA